MSGRHHRGRGPMFGASMAGLVNANAQSDAQARRRVLRLFGSILTLLYVLDMGSAGAVLYMECRMNNSSSSGSDSGGGGRSDSARHDAHHAVNLLEDEDFAFADRSLWSGQDNNNNKTAILQCLSKSIRYGFSKRNNDSSGGQLGDLFLLSLLRCVLTTLLLVGGIRYGQQRRPPSTQREHADDEAEAAAVALAAGLSCTVIGSSATNTNGSSASSEISTEADNVDDEAAAATTALLVDESAHPASKVTSTSTTATSTVTDDDDPLTEPLLHASEADAAAAAAVEDTPTTPRKSWCSRHWGRAMIQPAQVKILVLLLLFVTSTVYQVYAGLRVAMLDHHHHPEDETSNISWDMIITPLLCLTVLWINAQGYVFRTLLAEMTREEGLFLPPTIHRHPLYLEDGRGLAVHWCDLCRTRIGTNNTSNSCYRCSLCDFDICLKCAQRNDAATVGENVLRGDRGVRAEMALTTSSYFRRSIQVARSELPLLLISFILLATSSLSQLLLPHFQGSIIDKVIPDPATGIYDKAGFLHFIRIYIILMILQGAVSTLYSAIFTLVSRRLKFTIRNTLLEKIMAQDVAYFDGTESGRLISCLTNDLDLMMSPIQSSLSSLLSNVLILFGGMIMCFIKSYRLSMLAFVTVGPISYLWEQYAIWSKGLAREMLSYWAEGNGIASQALSQIRTVKAFGCEERVLEKYSETNRHALHCGIKDAWGNGITSALTGYLDLGSGVLILYYGGLLVYKGEMSVGELVTFQLFWNMMNNAYQNLQGLITSFTRSAAGAEKIFSLWDSDPDIDPKKGNDVDWPVNGHLKLDNVSFYYQMRPDNIVLKNFCLDIPAGKTIALVGRSGGGKSTIINLLLRFYDAREGKIMLDGRDYESLKVHQLRRNFGVVTQETELFPLTVEENIAYGLNKDDYTMDDVMNAAKKACAHDFISEMKDGYQTRIGERGNRISGGQRQRLAIARVFLRKPRIILLDEATSALDEVSQEAVQQALATLIAESNATVVLVAHRLSTVVNADSICVIDKGTVLEQGNHEELVATGGIYASMVEKQLKKKADLIDQDGDEAQKKKVAADDIDALLADK